MQLQPFPIPLDTQQYLSRSLNKNNPLIPALLPAHMNEVSMKFAILSSSIWFDLKIVSMCPRSDAKSVIQRTKSCYLARLTPNISHKKFEIKKYYFTGRCMEALQHIWSHQVIHPHRDVMWAAFGDAVITLFLTSILLCIVVYLYTCFLVYLQTCVYVYLYIFLQHVSAACWSSDSIVFDVYILLCILIFLYSCMYLFSWIVEYLCIYMKIFN